MIEEQKAKEKELISLLEQTIKRSSHIATWYQSGIEHFVLDNLEICFKLDEPKKIKLLKNGKCFYTMDCKNSKTDVWQNQRSVWFSYLYECLNTRVKPSIYASKTAETSKELNELIKVQSALVNIKTSNTR